VLLVTARTTISRDLDTEQLFKEGRTFGVMVLLAFKTQLGMVPSVPPVIKVATTPSETSTPAPASFSVRTKNKKVRFVIIFEPRIKKNRVSLGY
jgi:hypothetical protein